MMISLRRRRGTFAEVSRLPLFSVVKDHVEDGGKPDNKDFNKFQGVLLKTRSPLLRSRIPDQRPGRKSPPCPLPKDAGPCKIENSAKSHEIRLLQNAETCGPGISGRHGKFKNQA